MLRVICSNSWIITVCKCDQWVNNGITMENITLIKCFTGAIVKSVIFETSDENNPLVFMALCPCPPTTFII